MKPSGRPRGRGANSGQSDRDVFLNCPFDEAYRHLFEAAVFAIHDCGFRPRCALEVIESGETRIAKILEIIGASRHGIHDISRTELDEKTRLPRFNMPLELGIFLGAARFGGGGQRQKRCLILDREPYRYQIFCSDIAGQDIESHADDPKRLIKTIRDWLRNFLANEVAPPIQSRSGRIGPTRVVVPGERQIIARYQKFREDLPALASALGLDPSGLNYSDLVGLIEDWLSEGGEEGALAGG